VLKRRVGNKKKTQKKRPPTEKDRIHRGGGELRGGGKTFATVPKAPEFGGIGEEGHMARLAAETFGGGGNIQHPILL